ncbi:hypothetical protein FQR65_LT12313 [Abscondita terminalis]|nr:hypothetical protein FQR65_LT12313 [Abscondita terminalis]
MSNVNFLGVFLFLVLSTPMVCSDRVIVGIVRGVNVTNRDYPYQVSLEHIGIDVCGGALISANKVLTAGHCGRNRTGLLARCGSDTTRRGGQTLNVTAIKLHPNFTSLTLDNDVAVLTLERNFEIGDKCAPISLSNNTLGGNRTCWVSGWGTLENGTRPLQLQAVDVNEYPRSECQKLYPNNLITKNMICFGGRKEPKDAFQGDSGGPLVDRALKELVGIVSWGAACGDVNKPGVYANVAFLRNWINNHDRVIVGIVRGVNVTNRDYPYQVSLEHIGIDVCGGALISANKVLTAGHCGRNRTGLLARCGSDTTRRGGQTLNVTAIKLHPNFTSLTLDNDVAVLTLERNFEIGDKCAPISLSNNTLGGNRTCWVSGWGTLENGTRPLQLQAVDVNEYPRSECQKLYPNNLITKNMICFGGRKEPKDACQGDSGGPLVDRALKELVGIVSWGAACGDVNKPGVYANVAFLRNWINNQ